MCCEDEIILVEEMMVFFLRFEQVHCGQLLYFNFYCGTFFPGAMKLNSALYGGPSVNLDLSLWMRQPWECRDAISVLWFTLSSIIQCSRMGGAHNDRNESAAAFSGLVENSNS